MSVDVGDLCIGCGACKQVCPKKCISLQPDAKGFYYPSVHAESCVKCGICERVCPVMETADRKDARIILAMKNLDERLRKQSSSGGVFIALAESIIREHGVVYGCKLDRNLKAVHARADSLKGCMQFMGSKYVQSDMQGVYPQIEEDAKKGRKILFSGTGCQCDAVKKFFITKKLPLSNLFLCGLLCHGVPSPKAVMDYIAVIEEKYGGKAIGFVCRDKEKERPLPSCRGMRFTLQRHASAAGSGDPAAENAVDLDILDKGCNDVHFTMFKMNYLSRECCYHCNYTGFESVADILIADYWGCEIWHPEFFDRKGVSLVLIHSTKGEKLIGEIANNFRHIPVKKQEVMQKPLQGPPVKPHDYDEFWKSYRERGYWPAALAASKQYFTTLSFRQRIRKAVVGFVPLRIRGYLKRRKLRNAIENAAVAHKEMV